MGLDHEQLKARLLAIAGEARTLPWGHIAEAAQALGISEPTLRLLMAEAGVTKPRPSGPTDCADCGRGIKLRNKTGLCRPCLINRAKITLTCVNCGNTFQRRKGTHREFARRTVVQPRRRGPVCSKSCRAKVVQQCTWCGGALSPRWRARAARYPFCGAPDNCHRQAIRVLPVRYWSSFDPKLVPVKSVDARPSDAIALALEDDAPIFVEPEVFAAAMEWEAGHAEPQKEGRWEEGAGAAEIVAEVKASWPRQHSESGKKQKRR